MQPRAAEGSFVARATATAAGVGLVTAACATAVSLRPAETAFLVITVFWNVFPFAVALGAALIFPRETWRLAAVMVLVVVASIAYVDLVRTLTEDPLNSLGFLFLPVWILLLLPVASLLGNILQIVALRIRHRAAA